MFDIINIYIRKFNNKANSIRQWVDYSFATWFLDLFHRRLTVTCPNCGKETDSNFPNYSTYCIHCKNVFMDNTITDAQNMV
jgi:NADH pyrophosphatase NudC (nudix superfamily)